MDKLQPKFIPATDMEQIFHSALHFFHSDKLDWETALKQAIKLHNSEEKKTH